MHFGEYELSPSLIGLSLLHTTRPEAFQRLSVRASIPCYRDFTLDMCRSLGFASAHSDSTPSSGSLSLRRGDLGAMPRRRRQLAGSLCKRVLFTFPSRYWYTIGLTGVFSLAGWSRRIRAGFLVSRATQDTTTLRAASRTQLSCSTADLSRTFRSRRALRRRGPTTPRAPERARFGLLPGRSPLLGESLLFSFPAGTKMFQFPALAS